MDEAVMNKLIGIPFVNGGRDVATGVDCWGLVMHVYGLYDVGLPDFTVDAFAYQAIDALAGDSIVSRCWHPVLSIHTAKPPVVALMRIHHRWTNHAGVYVGDNTVLHTTEKTGVVRSKLANDRQLCFGRGLIDITGFYQYDNDNQCA